MKSHFAMMARYNAWANARLYAEARVRNLGSGVIFAIYYEQC
jgi:uncharacterized damage-inducible protein DinB